MPTQEQLLQDNANLAWSLRSTAEHYIPGIPKTVDSSTLIKKGTIHLGSFGSIGHADFETALSQIPFNGGLPLELRRGIVLLGVDFADAAIFSGIYDTTDSPLGKGTFTFDARDFGALLQERDVNPMVADLNQTVGSFIEEIISTVPVVGSAAGLAIENIATPTNPNNTPITMGTYYGNSKGSHFFARPEPAWGLIQRIAKDCGYVSYFLPDGSFYFGPRNRGQASGGGLDNVALVWSGAGPSDFLHDSLQIHHHGSRNAAFIVTVQSSNKKTQKQVVGTCAYLNPQLASDANLQTGPDGLPLAAPNAGMYVGLNSDDVTSVYGDLPIYNHFVSGLDQAQANLRALGIAREVAAQEIVLTCKVLGTQSCVVGQPVTVSGTGNPLVEGQQLVVVHSSLNIDVAGKGGFTNDLTLWKADELQVAGIEGVSTGAEAF